MRFRKRGKLALRYIGPYRIVEKVGKTAYHVELPPELARMHNVFHVSMLKKYLLDHLHILEPQPVQIKVDLTYVEVPMEILEWKL